MIRWWFRTGTEGRHGGLSAAGAPPPSVLGCVVRTIVLKTKKGDTNVPLRSGCRDCGRQGA